MEGLSYWVQSLADSSDLDSELLPTMPLVEIAGDRRVLIERHAGVTEYSTERICIKVKYGTVCVTGCSLELTRMTGQQLVISGQIDAVALCRRRR